jgi:predicted nucleic acid-binding Zn ribbon protein
VRNKLKNPVPLREILPQAFQSIPQDPKADLYRLQEMWSEWVGPLLGKKSLPLKIYGKRLMVEVAGSVWANELEFMKKSLLNKIRESLASPAIEEIRFRVISPSID